jgi:hypothetical protein
MRRGLLSLVLAFVACWYLVSPASSAIAGGWTIMRSPHLAAPLSLLYDVSCTDPDWCMAVGYSEARTQGRWRYDILTETWDGTAWSVAPSPELSDIGFKYLRSVSCLSRTWCMAVGRYQHANSNLAELWNGSSWSQVRTPNVSYGNQLNSVSCVTTSFCMAAGDGNGTLVETWSGSAWSVLPSPDAGKQPENDQAVGVSCPSQRFCMLLDLFDDEAKQDMATFAWDGTSWSALPTPNPGPATNALYRVDCASALACTAVGSEVLGQTAVALIEHWNGSSWSVAPTPAESSADNLTDVSCIATGWCAAVGDRVATAGPRTVRTLAEVSHGGTWMLSRTGSPSSSYSTFSGVSCGGSNTGGLYCVAVGYRSPGSGGLTPLIERYLAP